MPVKNLRGEVRSALVSTGLVRERNRGFVLKSPIYRAFFDAAWISDLKRSIGSEFPAPMALRLVRPPSEKKRVCIINTGGMISMELQPDGKIGAPHDLTAYFRTFPELFTIADFAAVPLMFKDSSNMNPDDWSLIAQAIYQRRDDGFQWLCCGAWHGHAPAYRIGSRLCAWRGLELFRSSSWDRRPPRTWSTAMPAST